MKKITLLMLLLALMLPLAAEPYYDQGSQMFSISVGTNMPLSLSSYENGDFTTAWGPGEDKTNLTFGGFGSIDYEVFLNSYLALGGEIGYQFNFTPGKKILTSVPIQFKMTTIPVQTGKFDIPISLGLGFNYLSFNGFSKFTFSSTLNVGIKYFITDEWGIGLNSGIYFVPELYSTNSKNSIFTFIPINAVVTYRH